MNIDGACHCGNITWTAVADPELVAVCFCSDCQTFGSSAFQYAARVTRESFSVTKGELKSYVKTAESGNARELSFCPDCATPIHGGNTDGTGLLSLRLGSCHQKAQLPPKFQIWCCSAANWVSVDTVVRLDKQGNLPVR